jgi:molybdopterin molybdotransferase
MELNAADLCTAGKPDRPLSVDAARLRALAAAIPVVEVETLVLDAAAGRILAEPVVAHSALPPFDNSAMDGYALRCADLMDVGPWTLPVADRIAAGDTRSLKLACGSVARIFTGAPIPLGADAVVMQESVKREGDSLILDARPRAGQNIRRRGEDQADGVEALGAGLSLTPPRLALIAGCGLAEVTVSRRVRIALFSTGDELAEASAPLGPGQIYNTNRVLLRAALSLPWAEVTDLGILRDEPATIRLAIRAAAESHDVILSSGGVSAGEEDHILDALQAEAADLHVLKVAIRPGKPLTVGRVGRAQYFGLPGNPYAAAVTFSQIALPALRRTAGLTEAADIWIPGVAGFDYRRTTGRREYVPVTWEARDGMGRPILQRLGQGASASLRPVALARGIAVIPPDLAHVTQGTALAVEPLDC